METLEPGKTLPVGSFIREAKGAPWGAGETSLLLALAHVVAAFEERLRIYKDTTKIVEETLEGYDKLEKVLSDPAPKLVFEVREISSRQEKLVGKIASAVHARKLLYSEKRRLTSTCDALKLWWQGLPAVAKVKTVYDASDQDRIETIRKYFAKLNEYDRYQTLFEMIPGIYGEDPVTEADMDEKIGKIVSAFEGDAKLLETGEGRVRNQMAGAVAEVFGAKGDMVQCEKAIQDWFEQLSPNQRDATRYDMEPDAQSFIAKLAESSITFEKKLMETIPDALGLDSVKDWGALRINDYVSKLTQAKKEVEAAAVVVPVPQIRGKEKFQKINESKWEVDEGGSIGIAVADGACRVVYTIDGTDPRNSITCEKSAEGVILEDVFSDKSAIQINARGLDASGNYSDLVTCSVVNKKKEYEVNVESDDLFTQKGTFKIPGSIEALKSVLGSTVTQALKDKVITDTQAQKLKNAFDEL